MREIPGDGKKRAYGHIITGNQHATVIVSLNGDGSKFQEPSIESDKLDKIVSHFDGFG